MDELFLNKPCRGSNPYVYENGREARSGIGSWLHTYNSKRPHGSLDDYTPDEVYTGIPLKDGPYPRKGELKKAAYPTKLPSFFCR